MRKKYVLAGLIASSVLLSSCADNSEPFSSRVMDYASSDKYFDNYVLDEDSILDPYYTLIEDSNYPEDVREAIIESYISGFKEGADAAYYYLED